MSSQIDWGKFGSEALEMGLEFLDNQLNHGTIEDYKPTVAEPSKDTQTFFSVAGNNWPVLAMVGIGIVALVFVMRK